MSFAKGIIYSVIVVIFFTTSLSSQLSSKKVDLLEKQVVRIVSYQNAIKPEDEKLGIGTGFLISNSGYIITNEHVINKSYKVEVYLGDSDNTEKAEAKIIKISKDLDLALLKIDYKGLPSALKISAFSIKKGKPVYSSGFPGASDIVKLTFSSTLTNGMVSNVLNQRWASSPIEREIIQHTSPINGGNSGGPLLDECGNVVGVNTLKLVKDGVDGVSLALSSLELIKFLDQTNVGISKVLTECSDNSIFSNNLKVSNSSFVIWGIAIFFMIICAVGIFLLNQKPFLPTAIKSNNNGNKKNYSYFLSGFKKNGMPIRIRLDEVYLNKKYGVHIGRASDFSDDVIKSAEISRVHARISNNQNGIVIEDLGSSNGIFINNNKINSFTPHSISLNDKLVFGDVELILTS